MSRLLLSSLFVALVAGLTLLACVPIEDELLPNIGDEMRITNDPEPNYDPCWYRTRDSGSGLVDLKTAQIAYHDGHTAFLYSFEDKSTVELYSAPTGFEITTLDSTYDSLLIALFDGTETRIVYRDHDIGNCTTLYQDNSAEIESIGGSYGDHGYDEYEMLLGRADGNIYYLIIPDDKQLDYGFYSEGFDVHLGNGFDTYSFAYEIGERTIIYVTWYTGYGYGAKQEELNNGHYNRYPMYLTCLSNASGDNDIWDFTSDTQITNKRGSEIEADNTYEYTLFNRVEDGRSDIYVVRRSHVEI